MEGKWPISTNGSLQVNALCISRKICFLMTLCVNMPGWTSIKSQVSYIVESHLLPFSYSIRMTGFVYSCPSSGPYRGKGRAGIFLANIVANMCHVVKLKKMRGRVSFLNFNTILYMYIYILLYILCDIYIIISSIISGTINTETLKQLSTTLSHNSQR